MRTVTAGDIMALMDAWAPPKLAEKWDHPGLQVGNPSQKVKKILVSLDLTKENIEWAAAHSVDMVISHHPFLFKPMKEINLESPKGQLVGKLIQNRIISFAAHTNLDSADEGVNDALADALKLENRKGFIPVNEEKLFKIEIAGSTDEIRKAEEYFCNRKSFRESGDTISFTVSEGELKAVRRDLASLGNTVIVDIYPLIQTGHKDTMGRIGLLPHGMNGKEAIAYIQKCLHIPFIRYAGNTDKEIKTVAVLGGAGASFMKEAAARGADLYLTGDLKYHEAQDAASMGLLIVDGGHFYTERVIVPKLAERLRAAFREKGWDVEVFEDSDAKDIFGYMAE